MNLTLKLSFLLFLTINICIAQNGYKPSEKNLFGKLNTNATEQTRNHQQLDYDY